MEKSTIQNFVHFCFNYPHNFVATAFKGHTHLQHLESKFTSCYTRVGTRAVIACFYSELDTDNQRILDEYILSLYKA